MNKKKRIKELEQQMKIVQKQVRLLSINAAKKIDLLPEISIEDFITIAKENTEDNS